MKRMNAELLTIGSELLSGITLNTNAAYLARWLLELDIPCQRQVSVNDQRQAIVSALKEAIERSELVIVTGGLGPTHDDLTITSIAEVTQRPLTLRPAIASKIRRFYDREHRQLQRAALRQAYLPEGGTYLPNPLGTAPGLWLRIPRARKTVVIVALPGVPAEMRAIMESAVLPRLRRLPHGHFIEATTLRTAGIVELKIETLLKRRKLPKAVDVGLYPNLGCVDIRLTATTQNRKGAKNLLSHSRAQLRRVLGDSVYGTGTETLEEVIGNLLVKHRKSLAIAESCTGGLVSHHITNVPGSSRYFRGGVVAYHNDLKQSFLDIPKPLLMRHGAVSKPVAISMAQGIRRGALSDIGLAITGIAGPTGGSATKPVGLVYFGLSDRRTHKTLRCHFFGDRDQIKAQAVQCALDWLRRYLNS